MIFLFGDCEVSVERRELRRRGTPAHVEPQVLDVLIYLLKHRERVVSKDELFREVWTGRVVSDATLTSRISAARKAIGDTGERQHYLRTVARRGFRFTGEVEERDPGDAESSGSVEPTSLASEPRASKHEAATSSRAEKPSIAVLPFVNLSRDPAQEYFADGIAEDLIWGLSRVRWLRVIARSSSFTYKSRPVDPRQVAGDLGVRYIVDGSVRRSGDQVRVSVELVDARMAVQLWSAHYDRDLHDILALQDKNAQTIVAAIEPELAAADWDRVRYQPPDNFNAWDHFRHGTWHLYRFTAEDIAAAQRHCRLAIAADADFSQPYVALAYACHLSLIFEYAGDPVATLEEGLASARRAVRLDERDSFSHAILGRLYMMAREFDLAIAETRAAIDLNPYSAQAYFGLGFALVVAGDSERALEPLLRAVELSPRDPNLASYGTMLATAHILLNKHHEAVEWARLATRQPSSHFIAHMHLVAALALAGDVDGALRARDLLLQLKPDFSAAYVTKVWPFRRSADAACLIEGLKKAGL